MFVILPSLQSLLVSKPFQVIKIFEELLHDFARMVQTSLEQNVSFNAESTLSTETVLLIHYNFLLKFFTYLFILYLCL